MDAPNPTNESAEARKHSLLEEWFEAALFNSRFMVLFAVVGALVAGAVLFLKGTLEIAHGVVAFIRVLANPGSSHVDDKAVILNFMPAIDNYLFATVLLIFSMGMYELFISKIDPSSRKSFSRPGWLKIGSLDDLKTYLSEVVVMILIINFFQISFTLTYEHPYDLLSLAGGIVLISISLYITHKIISHKAGQARAEDDD